MKFLLFVHVMRLVRRISMAFCLTATGVALADEQERFELRDYRGAKYEFRIPSEIAPPRLKSSVSKNRNLEAISLTITRDYLNRVTRSKERTPLISALTFVVPAREGQTAIVPHITIQSAKDVLQLEPKVLKESRERLVRLDFEVLLKANLISQPTAGGIGEPLMRPFVYRPSDSVVFERDLILISCSFDMPERGCLISGRLRGCLKKA